LLIDGRRWLSEGEAIGADEVHSDATLMAEYIGSFGKFFGDAAGA
jgi:hypothetical protein